MKMNRSRKPTMAGRLDMLTTHHPKTGSMIVQLCLQTSGSEAAVG